MATSWLNSVMTGTISKPETSALNRFNVGDAVEAQDVESRVWRRAHITAIANYRGREGYYVSWVLPADAPSWISRGGWKPGYAVREAQA